MGISPLSAVFAWFVWTDDVARSPRYFEWQFQFQLNRGIVQIEDSASQLQLPQTLGAMHSEHGGRSGGDPNRDVQL